MLKKYSAVQLAALCCGYSEAEAADYQGLDYQKVDDSFYEKYDITIDTFEDILSELQPFMQTADNPEPEPKPEHGPKSVSGVGDKKKCFRVKVRTINALGDTSHTKIDIQDYEERKRGEYFACKQGTVYVQANDMVEVVETLGKGTVLSIDEVGPGYVAS